MKPMSYPSASYAAARPFELFFFFLGCMGPVLGLGTTGLVLATGGGIAHASIYGAIGVVTGLPFAFVALVLRSFRMKRKIERSAFLASMENVLNG